MNQMTKLAQICLCLVAIIGLTACGEAGENAASNKLSESVVASAAANSDDQTARTIAGPENEAQAAAQEGEKEGTWGDIIYGDPNAPIEIIEYSSLTCPHCANFALNIFPKIKEKYVDTGKVRFVYRNFVTNRYDLAASTAARCGNADVTKDLMKLFFAKQQEWARASNPIDELAALARKGGISRAQFDRCLANREMHEHLVAMTQAGSDKYGINATPTLVIDDEKIEQYNWDNVDKLLSEK